MPGRVREPEPMRPIHLRTVTLIALILALACASQNADPLKARYPKVAARVLGGPGFTRSGPKFVPAEPREADPVRAAEGSLERRGRPLVKLAAQGSDAASMTFPGGLTVELKERGLIGRARKAGGAIAYPRANGTSYWTVTGEGFEEWIDVENAGDGPVAEWEVKGATLWQEGDAVLLADVTGTVRARVTAPRAYSGNGDQARAWLRVKGQVIALYTDVRGPALVDPGWTTVGSMTTARYSHTATLLPSGKVLVAGGWNNSSGGFLASAELYDPVAGTWSTTGSLSTARYGHTATLLPSGKVLVAAGTGASGLFASAEVYDPSAGTWSSTGSLSTARVDHTATLLLSGKVLVAGGEGSSYNSLASAELYDPSAGTWSSTGSLFVAREQHTATLLPSGEVLVAGGFNAGSGKAVASAELYDPSAGTWSSTGSLSTPRDSHTATLLPAGEVLVAGGVGASGSAELYGPAVGTWSSTGSLSAARYWHTATLLPSGEVLAAGGDGPLASAELYDEGRGASAASTPTLATLPASVVFGANLNLTGTLFTGVSEGSGGGTQSSPANYPLVQLEREDNEATSFASVTDFGATSATALLPSSLDEGWYRLSVVVNGVPSVAQSVLVVPPIAISPSNASVPPKGSETFSASGGTGLGYSWSLATNASGGSINASTGSYTAGATASVTDVVEVTDSVGTTREVNVSVTAGVSISPASPSVPPKGSKTFTASGGSGLDYSWSLATNNSGGIINPTTGAYTAGATGSVTDIVQVVDSLGNSATTNVAVAAGVSVSPSSITVVTGGAITFTASGGDAPYSWSFAPNGNVSRGTISTSDNTLNCSYLAGGQTGTDVIVVVDSLGNSGTAEVTVVSPPGGRGGCDTGGVEISALALAALALSRLLGARKRSARQG